MLIAFCSAAVTIKAESTITVNNLQLPIEWDDVNAFEVCQANPAHRLVVNNNMLLAATPFGIFSKSLDKVAEWSLIGLKDMNVAGLAANGNYILAITVSVAEDEYNFNILASEDAGSTFKELKGLWTINGESIRCLATTGDELQNIAISTDCALYISHSGFTAFEDSSEAPLLTFPGNYNSILFDDANPQNLFAGSYSNDYIVEISGENKRILASDPTGTHLILAPKLLALKEDRLIFANGNGVPTYVTLDNIHEVKGYSLNTDAEGIAAVLFVGEEERNMVLIPTNSPMYQIIKPSYIYASEDNGLNWDRFGIDWENISMPKMMCPDAVTAEGQIFLYTPSGIFSFEDNELCGINSVQNDKDAIYYSGSCFINSSPDSVNISAVAIDGKTIRSHTLSAGEVWEPALSPGIYLYTVNHKFTGSTIERGKIIL